MPSERQIIALIAVVAVISLVAIGMDLLTPPQQKLLLATTTSVKDTGLMDSLVEDFT
ncbi:MAG: hypothetical protein HY619_06870, partial [Thaumarchaeota archaeon]|nr:hypothetical protein [Nitrososphaerota archaeon]